MKRLTVIICIYSLLGGIKKQWANSTWSSENLKGGVGSVNCKFGYLTATNKIMIRPLLLIIIVFSIVTRCNREKLPGCFISGINGYDPSVMSAYKTTANISR